MTFYWGWVFSWSYAISGFGATLDQNWFLGTSVFKLFFLTTSYWGWVFLGATLYLDLEPHWIKIGSWGHLSSICSS